MKMTLNEIRRSSAEQLADARKDADQISETTSAEITPAIAAFALDVLGGDARYVPVIADRHGLYGWCSDGVEQKVLIDGGRPVFGWTLWEWPGALLTAEFHAVWQSPAGDCLDITPKPKAETSILFVPDLGYPIDFDFDQRPRNRRLRLYEGADRVAKARTLAAGLTGAKRIYEANRAKKAGLSLEDWLVRKVPVDPIPEAIDDLIDACAAFEEYYDSLGASGFVRPDDTLVDLMRRRIAAQQRFKILFAAPLSSRFPRRFRPWKAPGRSTGELPSWGDCPFGWPGRLSTE